MRSSKSALKQLARIGEAGCSSSEPGYLSRLACTAHAQARQYQSAANVERPRMAQEPARRHSDQRDMWRPTRDTTTFKAWPRERVNGQLVPRSVEEFNRLIKMLAKRKK